MTAHRLVLARHGAAASPPATADVDRPLTAGGRRDASRSGAELTRLDAAPDRVLCSPARRTRETWAAAAEAFDTEATVVFEPRIYDNDLDILVDLVRQCPEDAGTVLLIGHNPSMQRLVRALTDGPDRGFPPGATAVVHLGGPWAETDSGAGRLTTFWTP